MWPKQAAPKPDSNEGESEGIQILRDPPAPPQESLVEEQSTLLDSEASDAQAQPESELIKTQVEPDAPQEVAKKEETEKTTEPEKSLEKEEKLDEKKNPKSDSQESKDSKSDNKAVTEQDSVAEKEKATNQDKKDSDKSKEEENEQDSKSNNKTDTDKKHVPKPLVHAVVTQHKEKSESLKKTLDTLASALSQSYDVRYFVFSKSNSSDQLKTELIDPKINNTNIIDRINIGRDVETNLHYIVQHYDSLPDLLIFSHAETSSEFETSLKNLNSTTGYLSLSKSAASDCAIDYDSIPAEFTPLKKLIPKGFCKKDEKVLMNSNGLFAVSKKRILKRPVDFYKLLLDLSSKGQKANEKDTQESLDATPTLLDTIEQSWSLFFECHATANMYELDGESVHVCSDDN